MSTVGSKHAGSKPVGSKRAERDREWLTIHQASALVGVSPATLRRWCDAGDVCAFTTPGGHRRFARSAVVGMLPPDRRPHPTLAGLGLTADALTRAYQRAGRELVAWPAGIEALAAPDREPFRECGRAIVRALVDFVDAVEPQRRIRLLALAESAATRHGQLAAHHGVTIRETVELFLGFRAPFLRELGAVVRRRDLDATAVTDLFEAATDALDRLMPAVISGHEGNTSPREGRTTP
jgi:excisionase family DNA binding protein